MGCLTVLSIDLGRASIRPAIRLDSHEESELVAAGGVVLGREPPLHGRDARSRVSRIGVPPARTCSRFAGWTAPGECLRPPHPNCLRPESAAVTSSLGYGLKYACPRRYGSSNRSIQLSSTASSACSGNRPCR